jgi:hypothetical protein
LDISEVNFVYTGGSQTYTALENGYYKIEAWGAQGGSNVGMEGSMAVMLVVMVDIQAELSI